MGRLHIDRVPPAEALELLLAAWREAGGGILPAQRVNTRDGRGRVTAATVLAARSVPHYRATAMDGIAVHAALTAGASESRPLTLAPGQFLPVDTGDPLPKEADAVIMREDLRPAAGGAVGIVAPARPGQHVRPPGEDVHRGRALLGPLHVIAPHDQALLLAAGIGEVDVVARPRLTVIPTGDEVVVAEEFTGAPGEIAESNSLLMAGRALEHGAEAVVVHPVADDPDLLAAEIARAVSSSDVVVVNAGSSAGSGDFVPRVLDRLGRLLVHGVGIRPGHPTALALVGSTPVLGLPGYPVSAALTFDMFCVPVLRAMQGLPPVVRPRLTARLSRTVASRTGVEEYVRVRMVSAPGGGFTAVPLARGAGLLSTLVGADGLVCVPAASEGLPEGRQVDVEMLVPPADAGTTLHLSGGEDPLLSTLADAAAARGVRLSAAFPGSAAGLRAALSGEAHLGGVNLPGPPGDALPWIGIPDEPLLLVCGWRREQGLYVREGNEHDIMSVDDLARPGMRVAGRARGSGTRELFDRLLSGAGIGVAMVEYGSARAAAEAVAGDRADVGMGIRGVARDYGLSFIPVGWEHYFIAVPEPANRRDDVQRLLEILSLDSFRGRAGDGYCMEETGKRHWLRAGKTD